MKRIDVAVVGGGPAGATAARVLAERGAHVVLLEGRRIPRPKLCGGGLTPKALPYLGQRLTAAGAIAIPVIPAFTAIDRHIQRVELANARVPSLHLHLPEAPIAMVERARFDAALVEMASEAGADIRDGWAVDDVTFAEDGAVRLGGRRGTVSADVVIAADGDPSRIAHRLRLAPPRRRSLALEVDLPFASDRSVDELQLRFGIPGGYAWYFPKGDHANVGILSSRRGVQVTLRARLRRYIEELGLDPAKGRVKGHWIPQALRLGPASRGRVLFVGDAAATGDPFFGEGISYAMASAVLAADAVTAWADGRAGLDAYDRRLRRSLWPAMRRLLVVAELADRAPSISILALGVSGWARGAAIDGIAGTAWPFTMPASRTRTASALSARPG